MRAAIHHLINCDTFDFYPETTLATKRGTHQERLHLQKKTMLWNYTDKNATSNELEHLPGHETCFCYFQDIWKLSNLEEEAVNHSEESRFHLNSVRSFELLKNSPKLYVHI